MAHTTRLDGSWTLTDGIMEPFPIVEIKDVAALLIQRGILPAKGFTRECEWIFARNWEYRCTFEASEETDERAYLCLTHVFGAGNVLVNGECCGTFTENGGRIEITRFLTEGENTVSVRFDAPKRVAGCADFFAPIGLAGKVSIEYGSFLDILRHDFSATDGVFTCDLSVNAHIGGKYIFSYTVIPECGEESRFAFTEHLRACEGSLTHTLKVENCAYYDRKNPEDSAYIVRLSVERGGIGCAAISETVANLEKDCRAESVVRTEFADRAVFSDMGAEGIDTHCDCNAALEGFLPVKGDYAPVAFAALSSPDLLLDDPAFTLQSGEAWRYSGSKPYPFEEMEHLFGVNASGDVRRAAKLTRFLQAERLLRETLALRGKGMGVAFDHAVDECARPYSCALIESDGTPRPAYSAAKCALLSNQCLTDAPLFFEKDTLVRMRVGLIGKKLSGMYSVKGELFSEKGDVMASLTFPAYSTDAVRAGEISVHLPDTVSCGVLRVTATTQTGAICGKADFTICWGDSDAPMESLLSLAPAKVELRDGRLLNTGSVTAFSVSTGLYYGALLPGESAPVKGNYELFNG